MPSTNARADMAAYLDSQGVHYRSDAFIDAMIALLRSITQ